MGTVPIEVNVTREEFDIVVVGAGISGLLTAKALLDVRPSVNLVIIDRERSVGGVWCKDRVYPGLNVQSSPKYFELPYFKYTDVTPPVEYNGKGFITGPSMARYLEQWAENMGLMKYIRLGVTIRQITRETSSKKWLCHIADGGGVIASEKLVVANGIASLPKYPELNYSNFTGPVMHHRYFGTRREEWDREEVKTVAVYGSGKGSWDNMVELLKAGKKVKWIFRNEGRGAPWIMEDRLPNGKPADVVGFSRILSLLLPNLYQDDGFPGWHYFFKRNFFGRTFSKFFMDYSRNIAISTMGPMTDKLEKVIPELAPFWMYHPLGVNNYDVDIYDYIRNGDIDIIRGTITSMEGNTINLNSGESVTADAVVFATGWKAEVSLFNDTPELEMNLGIPSKVYTEEYSAKWKQLEEEADKKVYELNPILKSAPKPPRTLEQESGPFRLYHYMVPAHPDYADRSIVFLGISPTPGTVHQAVMQGLWTAAYMHGKLDLPSIEELEKKAAYELRFIQIRCVGIGNEYPLISFDFMSIITMYMQELGLNPFLKKGWWREITEPYTCEEYEHLTKEWREKNGIIEGEIIS